MQNLITENSHLERDILERDVPEEIVILTDNRADCECCQCGNVASGHCQFPMKEAA